MDDLIKVAITFSMMAGFPLLFYAGIVGIRAFQRRLEQPTPGPELQHEIEQLRARVAELELMQGRVEELEERMDFSERVLTQDKPAGRLQP